MARIQRADERRRKLLPLIADTFRELGYRRTTTAELARRCRVQEPILYRLWNDKRAMFIAAIDYVRQFSEAKWSKQGNVRGKRSVAERILQQEAAQIGEFRNYRLIFTGLSELDDKAIRESLRAMYGIWHKTICGYVEAHRGARKGHPPPPVAAWALMGLGTIVTIGSELGLLSEPDRRALLEDGGKMFLGGKSAS